ncbi:neuferricin-like [Styela clava]|uniref:neuferricin-like n=1 Tax=Styela clava TaxID=7725 RepID=UPI0019392D0D|nr:neuferricin-like [Styela clava]
MGFKSGIFVLVLGVAIGYFVRDYGTEIEAAKAYVFESGSRFMDSFQQKQNKPAAKKSAPASEKSSISEKTNDRLFTKEELWNHYRGGKDSKGLYLAILGKVYDVSKGAKFYEPGGGYDFFAGRDGTKAYSTGDFTDKGLTDDLTGVGAEHFGEYENWVTFYEEDYTYVGKLIGNFYDANGQPTAALREAQNKMMEARKLKAKEEEHEKLFPRCNSEWTQETGSRVWCSTKSGGIERDWVGVPRMLKPVGVKNAYCVCIRDSGPPSLGHTEVDDNRGNLDYPYLQEIKGCDPKSFSCKI